ncbi:hypothetical protein BHM03_00052711 [Ensete ventricosum]|nr:hypothetical protein BHM03_00052711 [Ensete ventricosum]
MLPLRFSNSGIRARGGHQRPARKGLLARGEAAGAALAWGQATRVGYPRLGIGPSLDDEVESRRKFARRFTEGIGKPTGNAKGDHLEEDRRTCRKITRGCRSMQELGLN